VAGRSGARLVRGSTGFTGKLRFPGLPVEDHGVATFALASGAIVTVESSWVAAAGSGFDFGLQVLGSHGAVRLAGKAGALSWEGEGEAGQDAGEPDQALGQPGTGRPGQLEHFVSMIRNPEPAGRPDVDDACENVALALAFYEAAEAIAPPPPGS
jgi:predicted dehydrogenase